MPAKYPQEDDLTTLLASTGVVDTQDAAFTGVVDTQDAAFTGVNAAAKLRAAIAEWEKRTGYTPFVAAHNEANDLVETTRLFDPPFGSRELSVRDGLLSVSLVTVLGTPYVNGAADPAVLGADYYLTPSDAPAKNRPYTGIHFSTRPGSRLPQSIAVTGVWGYAAECPDDVWEAILHKAAALCVPQLSLQISRGVYEWREGDVLKRFAGSGSGGPLSAERAQWETSFMDCLRSYKRVTV